MWMTDLETLLFVLGSGTSGVQGTALSLIHCSREDSVAFTVVSFVTRTVKGNIIINKHQFCRQTALENNLTFGAIRFTISDISTLMFLFPLPETIVHQMINVVLHLHLHQ